MWKQLVVLAGIALLGGHAMAPPETGHCQRHRIIWSGGVALRGPARVPPRPVRSKWDTAEQSRVRCPPQPRGVFEKHRVSADPEIR